MVNGGWYNGRQYWNGQLGAPGVINNPSQQGYQQAVSPEVNRQSSVAQGKAPDAIQNYLNQQNGQSASSSSNSGGSGSFGGGNGLFDAAQSILSFQQKANGPIVGALQKQQQSLDDRYKDLLSKIKNNQGIATDRQTTATNTELGNRGIGPDSGLYQKTLTDALNPITDQYTQTAKEATTAQGADSANLALMIAQAQAGDPTAALQAAISLRGQNLSSSGGGGQRYVSIGNGLYDTQTGQIIQNPAGASSANLPDLSTIFQ